jgi:DNA polymerase-3 subunit delta
LILTADKLEADLARILAPIYLITGDEPLLTTEAADRVRTRAREEGYSERVTLTVDRYFDWNELRAAGGTMSLFADKRMIELTIPNAKPGADGARALSAYAASAPDDTLLLVLTAKLDKKALQLAWVKSLAAAGRVIQVYSPDRGRLPGWVASRMKDQGLEPAEGVAELIAERVEGNLLAADQEIKKLSLLLAHGRVEAEDVARAVADSARYDIFDLSDAVSQGDVARCHRVLTGLQGEGAEPTLVLWALVRELRALSSASWAMEHGQREDQAFRAAGIWPRRQSGARAAIRRHGWQGLAGLIRQAAGVDRVIKGSTVGKPWRSLGDLAIAAAAGASGPRRTAV